jgi:hypothetical protein
LAIAENKNRQSQDLKESCILYLYVRLFENVLPASRNSSRALMASFVEYHRCGCGRLPDTSLKKNLLWFLIIDIPLRLES